MNLLFEASISIFVDIHMFFSVCIFVNIRRVANSPFFSHCFIGAQPVIDRIWVFMIASESCTLNLSLKLYFFGTRTDISCIHSGVHKSGAIGSGRPLVKP